MTFRIPTIGKTYNRNMTPEYDHKKGENITTYTFEDWWSRILHKYHRGTLVMQNETEGHGPSRLQKSVAIKFTIRTHFGNTYETSFYRTENGGIFFKHFGDTPRDAPCVFKNNIPLNLKWKYLNKMLKNLYNVFWQDLSLVEHVERMPSTIYESN